MFDDGEDRRAWRPVDPPLAVEVRLLWAFPRRQGGGAGDVPLWVDAAGLDLRAIVPGMLDGWLLTSVGTWWGRVALQLQSRNGDVDMPAVQLVPAEALRPMDPARTTRW